MNLLQKTKELCKTYGIKPARSKGQNFLIKDAVYDNIVGAADLKSSDVVLEVGPGLGFLTSKVAQKAEKVIAVELDDKLAEVLKIGLDSQGIKNVEVINENVLDINLKFDILRKETKFPIGNLVSGGYKIAANLPYNITSIFLRKFLSAENKPELMVLMLQKEVAERIIAKPGKMSLLAVSVQFYARSEIMQIVPKNNFWPEPKVDSAIIKLRAKSQKLKVNEKEFFRLVKIGFSAKRKMLKNNLMNGFHITQAKAEELLKKADFNLKIRAQELSVEDWVRLFGEFRGSMV